jgi:NTE family protein
MAKAKPEPISLALQGGGAHGAYTWGVLDRLLEDDSLDVKAISATSAGAMNAVALAAGYHEAGREGAKARLEAFWSAVSREGAPFEGLRALAAGPFAWLAAFQASASPYDVNPLNLNPLADVLRREIDFDAVRASRVDLFLSATNVETGRVKVFSGEELSADAVLASAALPQSFQAVEMDSGTYWDGGYLGNPSLFPLIYSDAPRDVLMVLLNPIERPGVPRSAAEIAERINEISFNAALIGELRSIAFVQKLLDEGMLKESARKSYRRLNLHGIRGGQDLKGFDLSSKSETNWRFLNQLRALGRSAADGWLETCAEHVGTGTSSLNLKDAFLDG